VFALLFFPLSFVALMSGMIFDAPGAEDNIYNFIFAYSLWGIPLSIFFSIPASAILYKYKKKYNIALLVTFMPLLMIIFSFIFLFFAF